MRLDWRRLALVFLMMGAQTTLALFDLQAGLFTTTWGIGGAFLLLVPVGGWWRRSAYGIAALAFVGMAFPKAAPGQFSSMLFLIWILVAGIAMARRPQLVSAATPIAAGA